MKVYEYSLYYNERDVAEIKARESQCWVDELHICEANRTFRGASKPYEFDLSFPHIRYHMLNGNAFREPYYFKLSRRFPFIRKASTAWLNEAIQRNYVTQVIDPLADDIVVLSDIDEIIDSRYVEKLLAMARDQDIVTVRLHFTMFYLNLFSTNWDKVWNYTPEDYSYRVFVMTGRYFQAMKKKKLTSNTLRRRGEGGKLTRRITCMDTISGFHHSWLGGGRQVLTKLKAYAHDSDHHVNAILDKDGNYDEEKVRDLISRGESLFPGHRLERQDPDTVDFLPTIRENVERYRRFIL